MPVLNTVTGNRRRALASAAMVTAAMLTGRVARAADSSFMITWSVSGSTAMRNFTISTGFTTLEAGSTLTLSNGTYSGGTDGLQLSPSTYTGLPVGTNMGAGVRMEWHEQGSVEGILELTNDQIGFAGGIAGPSIVDTTSRVPSGLNPIRLNRNNFTTNTSIGGYTIGTSSYNVYDPLVYSATGANLQGGQNKVQMAISDVKPIQGYSKTVGTTPALGAPAWGLAPGNTGFGKGNPLLTAPTVNGLGVAGGRQQLVDDSLLNMGTTTFDPGTIHNGGGSTTYSVGSWNSNGIDNLVSKTVAMTATVFAANPGTGLTQLNKGDAQWLQVAGRLQNGVDFNVTERDVNSGTRNTFANNTGVDGSWAAGDNDDGNGNPGSLVGTATVQYSIGNSFRFSGKTAGGGQLRPTVQNNRMALGPLGMSDAIGSAKNNAVANPVRALAYADSLTDVGASFVQPTAATITDGSYVAWQQEQYLTVRTPDANYNNDDSVKGDPLGDVAKLRNNVLSSVNATFPNLNSLNTPADQLLFNSFILPQMMLKAKDVDGGPTTDVSGVTLNGKTHTQWRQDLLTDPTLPGNFNTASPTSVTAGVGTNYGRAGSATINGAIDVPITAKDINGAATSSSSAPKGNYLFGNFNQNGVRDFDAVRKAALAQAALEATGSTSLANVDLLNTSVASNVKVQTLTPTDTMNGTNGASSTSWASKGDLIAMGDFNSDGKFNGKDLYMMARGAAVTDSLATSSTNFNGGTLGATAANFGDKIRSAVLRKNAALDGLQFGSNGFAQATTAQKLAASANVTNDPTGANAFNKFDVNRDGLVGIIDAKFVDHFVGSDYRNLADQVNAVYDNKMISLVDVELDDTGDITNTDFNLIKTEIGSTLTPGDANFDGKVDIKDLHILALHFNAAAPKWSDSDFTGDGQSDLTDLTILAQNWQFGVGGGPGLAVLEAQLGLPSVVPEPASLGLLALGGALTLRRRRR